MMDRHSFEKIRSVPDGVGSCQEVSVAWISSVYAPKGRLNNAQHYSSDCYRHTRDHCRKLFGQCAQTSAGRHMLEGSDPCF